MKKRALLSIVWGSLILLSLSAQTLPSIPLDPAVRHGQLDNGLTYYIRHNERPKGQADFYIVQKVGSILEEEHQRGLAHFLEHMAFQDTHHFPDNLILNYLESIGVKFGYNLNASTGMDQTIYNITNVPVSRQGIIDSCLLILHDWSSQIILKDEEIDKERGVIREELRTRSNANLRLIETTATQIYPGSRYANRFPIGLLEVINNFPYQVIKDYYHQWYRPDLQGIIVVGDIDPEKVEAQVKTLFGSIPKAENPTPRPEFEVPDNQEPIISVVTDKEATDSRIYLFIKHDPLPAAQKQTVIGMQMNYLNLILGTVMQERFSEIIQKPNTPFIVAMGTYGEFFLSQTKDAFSSICLYKENKVDTAFIALATEMEKIKRFGITSAEYDRAKASVMTQIEKAYNERDKEESGNYVKEYISHFINNNPTPGIEIDYQLYKQLSEQLPVQVVNQYVQSLVREDNWVVAITGPEKEGLTYPSKEQINGWIQQVKTMELTAPKEETVIASLITNPIKKGKIKKQIAGTLCESTTWELSNGAKVILKPTDFKQDEILVSVKKKGGYAGLDATDSQYFHFLADLGALGGFGNFSITELGKALAGKNLSLDPEIKLYSTGISGNTTVKDAETMFQLLYLMFTAPREDKDAFTAWQGRYRNYFENLSKNPMKVFSDSIAATTYGSNPYTQTPTAEQIDAIDYAKGLTLFKQIFSDPSAFTFTFVGNIDPQTFKPLVEQYIASLPKTKIQPVKMVSTSVLKGERDNIFLQKMETVKNSVLVQFTTETPYSLKNALTASILKQVMDLVYTQSIREDEGGTYGVSVQASISKIENQDAYFSFYFDTDTLLQQKLTDKAIAELKKVAQEGPQDVHLNKVKEYMVKKYHQDIKENSYWLNKISEAKLLGWDTDQDYLSVLESITRDDIKEMAGKMVNSGNQIKVIMTGTKE